MNKFDIISRVEVSTAELGFSINEYKFYEFNSESNLITFFFKDGFYKREDFSHVIRYSRKFNKVDKDRFLKSAFNLEKIEYNDFHKLSKSEVFEFVWENIPIWKERKIEEETILFEKAKFFINSSETNDYYVISKEFFDQTLDEKHNTTSEKLIYDSTIYEYYFLIVWIDLANYILTIAHFDAD